MITNFQYRTKIFGMSEMGCQSTQDRKAQEWSMAMTDPERPTSLGHEFYPREYPTRMTHEFAPRVWPSRMTHVTHAIKDTHTDY